MSHKVKVGITGKNGFVGTHLYNTLQLFNQEFETIDFQREWFDSPEQLENFVKNCDVIVHLAALNRHENQDKIFQVNTDLTTKLTDALKAADVAPHVLMSSSTQEANDNLYGNSKKQGREKIAAWAKGAGAIFTGLIIPNVFGPFGLPNYNSVVATFCHKVSHNEEPVIHNDGVVKLIYVGDLINEIIDAIRNKTNNDALTIEHHTEVKVSDILSKITHYKKTYQDGGEIPSLNSDFDYKLFNTYRCYINIASYFPRKYTQHTDARGTFVEIIRLGIGGQASFSTTVPGIKRGNHFPTRKIERFAVIKGKALIQLRRIGSNEVLDFYLDGEQPAYVDMPIWYTHNIKNVGDDVLYTNFWINEPYNPDDADTYFENV